MKEERKQETLGKPKEGRIYHLLFPLINCGVEKFSHPINI